MATIWELAKKRDGTKKWRKVAALVQCKVFKYLQYHRQRGHYKSAQDSTLSLLLTLQIWVDMRSRRPASSPLAISVNYFCHLHINLLEVIQHVRLITWLLLVSGQTPINPPRKDAFHRPETKTWYTPKGISFNFAIWTINIVTYLIKETHERAKLFFQIFHLL